MESRELIFVNEDGTLNFGNCELAVKTKVSDFEYRGDVYKVKTYADITKLERNEMFVYESVPGTDVDNFAVGDEGVTFLVAGKEAAQITLGLEDDTEYQIWVDGVQVGWMKTNMSGKLTLSVEFSQGQKEVKVVK
ncbi:MAG: endosialidase [Lachnospiraceae bacterium]|nr:endosialidase [Lachnospiraceae bacterium]